MSDAATKRSPQAEVERGLQLLREAVVTIVRATIREQGPADCYTAKTSPMTPRRFNELARQGKFPGAYKEGGHWTVPRAAFDAYIQGHARFAGGKSPEEQEVADVVEEILSAGGGRR